MNNSGSCTTTAFGTGSAELQILEEIADALAKSGIELQNFHSEGGTGQVSSLISFLDTTSLLILSLLFPLQYELVTGPLSPLEAADALVFTRETVYNIAAKHGLRATLAPTLHDGGCKSQ